MRDNLSRYVPDLLKGNTDCLLLSLIKEQPLYGYQIIKEIRKRSRGYFHFKEGTVYPALHRLEDNGLIQGQWQRLSSGQERRYYRITGKGIKVLEQKRAVWWGFATAVNLVLEPVKARADHVTRG